MKILHLIQRGCSSEGGAVRVAAALANEQHKNGHRVCVLALYGNQVDSALGILPETATLRIGNSRQALTGLFRLARFIRKWKPDVLHCHDGITWPRLLLAVLRIPVVYHGHLAYPSGNSWKEKIQGLVTRGSISKLIAISEPVRESWVAGGLSADRICLIENGVSTDVFHPVESETKKVLRAKYGLPVRKKIILWLGRAVCTTKGLDRALETARELSENSVLLIVGDGPDRVPMEKCYADLVDSGRVIFAGNSDTPAEFFQLSDIFYFTSRDEPFGLTLLEAAATGLPIAALKIYVGGGRELLVALGISPLTEDFAAAARYLESEVSPIHPGPEFWEKYSWAKINLQVELVYNKLIGTK